MLRFAEGYVGWGIAHPGAYQLIFESADQLGLETHEGGPGWDLILGAAALIAEAGGLDDTEAELMATRVWVGLHGLVSLRIHKAGLQWATTPADEAGAIVRMHLTGLAADRS
jgi:hypothetical protein